jgi:hypothetical protein
MAVWHNRLDHWIMHECRMTLHSTLMDMVISSRPLSNLWTLALQYCKARQARAGAEVQRSVRADRALSMRYLHLQAKKWMHAGPSACWIWCTPRRAGPGQTHACALARPIHPTPFLLAEAAYGYSARKTGWTLITGLHTLVCLFSWAINQQWPSWQPSIYPKKKKLTTQQHVKYSEAVSPSTQGAHALDTTQLVTRQPASRWF